MPRIITISREFGSGGREIGKRLADELGFHYYDREIIEAIADKINLNEDYIEHILDGGNLINSFPITFGRSFIYTEIPQQLGSVMTAQTKFIRSLAERDEDFIIVGRNADLILKNYNPLNIFVYADLQSKVKRCFERAPDGENLTEKEMIKKIKQVDSGRAKQRQLVDDSEWGDMRSYHLCINTSRQNIKKLTANVAEFAKSYFDNQN